MNRFFKRAMAAGAIAMAGLFGSQALAIGWPANYDGVMLQGFYWDSYENKGYGNTKWSTLTGMADELSQYFDLIWVPNSGKAASSPSNGYDPVYWFTNHNSSFGTQTELKTMISTYKGKGVGIIEDCVVNHRSGATNWYNFPTETWNGKTYTLNNGSICSTDEVWSAGQNCPASYKGAADTGEDFNGSRDLDHTNTTVQSHIKDYVKFLLNDLGYAGLRYDMVKGYGGQYTKIYNQANNVAFSVGEYWDGSFDAVAGWIEATGKTSAAFDFPCKYQINKALGGYNENLNELVWKANGKDQPAGLIHNIYPQYAVTFVDNHDTFRDGSKFDNDYHVMAANAFILMSPGTPCIFWPHYYSNKSAMQALIKARKAVGIHNLSSVNVLKVGEHIYVAEVTGKKGKAIVKIGSESYSPASGYTKVASGDGYAVWTTTSGGNQGGNTGGNTGEAFTVYFDNTTSKWTTPYIHYWGSSESSWPGVAMTKETDNIWKYTVPAGTTGILFNAGDGDATKTTDFDAVANHVYTTAGDQGVYNGGGGNQGGNDNPGTDFKVYFDNTSSKWANPHIHHWGSTESAWPGVKMSQHKGQVWVYTVPAGTTGILFNAGDGDASKTSDFVAVANHLYTTAGDQGVYSDAGGNTDPTPNPGTYPATVYMIGNVDGAAWSTSTGTSAKGNNGVYTYNVTIDDSGEGSGYFAFATTLGADWGAVNSGDRYGAPAENTPIANGQTLDVTLYAKNVNASGSQSWMIAAGKYTITLNLATMKVSVGTGGGNTDPDPDPDKPVTGGLDLYVVGDCNDWKVSPDYKFTYTGNDTYTLTLNSLNGQFKVKDEDPDWKGVNLGGDSGGEDVPNVDAVFGENTLWQNSSVNLMANNLANITLRLTYKKDSESASLVLGTKAGVEEIETEEAQALYFNLQGVRVDEPLTPGVYIRVRANKSDKVIVK